MTLQNNIDRLSGLIKKYVPESTLRLMEVCGTHTVSIAKAGLKELLPENVELISGPGCPVCVTSTMDIDKIIELSKIPNLIIASFGDMIRVPGSTSSLMEEKSHGGDVRVIYSPLDCIKLAMDNPDAEIVFIGVGFETTTPMSAILIDRASQAHLTNLSVLCLHKTVPNALRTLLSDDGSKIDGFILPGHVSTIIGEEPYQFLASEFNTPSVIAGFDPMEILSAITILLMQIAQNRSSIENAYPNAVKTNGNPLARQAINRIFELSDSSWRGLGIIKNSSYKIRHEYALFDAEKRFEIKTDYIDTPEVCNCADILKGQLKPIDCPFFANGCTPITPIGPCMVSSEGACAAHYKYYR